MVMKGKQQKVETKMDPNRPSEYVDINRLNVELAKKPKTVMKNG